MTPSYDVVVDGAGPVGSVAAVAHARRGARVLLLEASPRAAGRLAGEWIHPEGVAVLERLGLERPGRPQDRPAARGFAVLPDDGHAPILLPYEDGAQALAWDHAGLVESLRTQAADSPGVTLELGARVTALSMDGPAITYKGPGGERRVCAARIVGADGRASLVRRAIGIPRRGERLSQMAGISLHGSALPYEGFGHVLLGGPGPVLMYRIGPARIRACLDLPADLARALRDPAALHAAFAPWFPPALRPAFRAALLDGRVEHAAVRFTPRAEYGRGAVALVGDAVGQCHPLTAAGMTVGFGDAEHLARCATVAQYCLEREAQSYPSELLANALYAVFGGANQGAALLRSAVYDSWRSKPALRRRTMRLLSGADIRSRRFAGAFGAVAIQALRSSVEVSPGHLPGAVLKLTPWLRWPAAGLLPGPLRRRLRPSSTAETPLALRRDRA